MNIIVQCNVVSHKTIEYKPQLSIQQAAFILYITKCNNIIKRKKTCQLEGMNGRGEREGCEQS